ncbi:MAG TPA: TolC family protein [Sphingomicrobium sp.]|nr:TolC family protein [Sphingomicrobium sp.]
MSAFESDAIASEEAAIAAGALPDLQLTLGIQDFPVTGENAFSPTDDDFTMYTIGLMREQVRRSKRQAEASQLRAEAFAARAGATAQERQIQREVMIAWIDAVEAKAKQRLFDRLIADLKVAHQVTEAGIPTGLSTPALALQMQAEIALVQAQEAETQGEERRARAAMGRWIGAAAERPLPNQIPSLELPARARAAASVAQHPQILAAQAQELAARRQIDVTTADRKRDLTWSVTYGWRPKYGDLVSAQVSFPLLINKANRQNRRVGEATARNEAARLRTEDTKRQVLSTFATSLADYNSAEAQLAIINNRAVTSLEASLAAAKARYGAGQGTLELPLTIVRRYIEVTIELIEKHADRARAATELTYLTQDAAR